MVDYGFYKNDYLGSVIPEKAFSGVAAQAQRYLDRLKRIYRVESSGEDAEKLAVCAMAETLWDNRNGGLFSASAGSASARYAAGKTSLKRELFDKASIYLDIYRGVGQPAGQFAG